MSVSDAVAGGRGALHRGALRRVRLWKWALVGVVALGSSCSSDEQSASIPGDGNQAYLSEQGQSQRALRPDDPSPARTSTTDVKRRQEVVAVEDEAELTVVGLPDRPGDSDAVVLFPDGMRVATCGEDGKIELYGISSQEVMASYDGLPGVPRLAVSPDGKLLAQGSDQNARIQVWDVDAPTEPRKLEGHTLPVSAMAFAPHGSTLVTAGKSSDSGAEGEIKIWNLADELEPVSLEPKSGISAIAFSPDGDYLASAGVAKPVGEGQSEAATVVWNLKTREAETSVTNRRGSMYQVAFSPDGELLAFSERNGPSATHVAHRIRLVDPLTGEARGMLFGHMGEIHGLAFSPDGQYLVSAGQDGHMRIWQLPTMSERSFRDLNGYRTSEVTFSKDGRRLAVAAGRGSSTIHPTVWSFEYAVQVEPSPPGRESFYVRILKSHTVMQIQALAFSSDGNSLALLSRSDGARVYDTSTGTVRPMHVPDHRGLFLPAFSPSLAQAVFPEDTLRLRDLKDGREVHDFADPTMHGVAKAICAVAFSPDERLLASSHADVYGLGTVKLHDLESRDVFALSSHPEGTPTCIAFSADGTKLVTGSSLFNFDHGAVEWVGPVCVWDLDDTENASDWRMQASRETVQGEVSKEAKAAFAKAAGRYKQTRRADVAEKALRPVVSQLTEINVSTDPRDFRWQQLRLNATGAGLDAVRFTVSGDQPVDLMWAVIFTPEILDCRITPAGGRFQDAKERFALAEWRTSTGTTFEIVVVRVLESPEIRPGREYIAWFALDTDEPVDTRISVNLLPQGSFVKRGWAWPIYDRQFADVPLIRRTRIFFHGDRVTGVAISPDGSRVASVGRSGGVRLWDVAVGDNIATLASQVAAFSPDGRLLATSGAAEECTSVVLWDAGNGEKVRALSGGHLREVCVLAFSPDGKRLASGGRDGLVTLWDLAAGEPIWKRAEE